jgi:hypothetical protein
MFNVYVINLNKPIVAQRKNSASKFLEDDKVPGWKKSEP